MKKRLNSSLYLKFFSKREDSLKIFFVSLQRLGGIPNHRCISFAHAWRGKIKTNKMMEARLGESKVSWFCLSVRDIRGYRVEEWSDFTDIVKKG